MVLVSANSDYKINYFNSAVSIILQYTDASI